MKRTKIHLDLMWQVISEEYMEKFVVFKDEDIENDEAEPVKIDPYDALQFFEEKFDDFKDEIIEKISDRLLEVTNIFED